MVFMSTVSCERHGVAEPINQRLNDYNSTKSKLMVFKATLKTYTWFPAVSLNGSVLSEVTKFQYLGHGAAETLDEGLDMERERRALSVRANVLVRRLRGTS